MEHLQIDCFHVREQKDFPYAIREVAEDGHVVLLVAPAFLALWPRRRRRQDLYQVVAMIAKVVALIAKVVAMVAKIAACHIRNLASS